MDRRNFLRTAGAGAATYFFPWNSLTNLFSQNDGEKPRFAHLEDVPLNELTGLYIQHPEVARDIHAEALRRMTGQPITVELIKISGSQPELNELSTIQNLRHC
jgi:hypothetical protein